MPSLLTLFLLAACGTPAPPAAPKEAPTEATAPAKPMAKAEVNLQHGKKVMEGKCSSCHGTEVYTRADHKVQSAEALKGQVNTCGGAAKINGKEKKDVTAYLATEMYHFE